MSHAEISYGQFPSRQAQEPTAHSAVHAPNFVPSSFPATRQRYEDVGHDTRQIEVLAHQLRVEADDQDKFSVVNRRNNPNSLSQTPASSILPPVFSNQQPQFGDLTAYPRQPIATVAQGPSLWSGIEDSAEPYLSVNDGVFQEGYSSHHVLNYQRTLWKTISAEARNRNQNNGYYMNGNTPQPGMESSRSGVSVWPPCPQPPRHPRAYLNKRLNTHEVQSHQQGHLNPTPMLLPRDQPFPRTPYGLSYQYQPYNGVRLPVESYIQPMIQNQPPRRHDDFTHNLRSVLLEEFRSNSKSNKRYELKVC